MDVAWFVIGTLTGIGLATTAGYFALKFALNQKIIFLNKFKIESQKRDQEMGM